MARKSNTVTGKAFEYAVLEAFRKSLSNSNVDVCVDVSGAYETAKNAFESLDEEVRLDYKSAANTAVGIIGPLEPRLSMGKGDDALVLRIQSDAQGQRGDVRDVVCVRSSEGWEIGISCKHNHEALKHPRVTAEADFGMDWIGAPCSAGFLKKIGDVMSVVEGWRGTKWRVHEDKHDVVYKPVLQAYEDEIARLCSVDKQAPAKLVKYFFGAEDFYKVIAKDNRARGSVGLTKVMAFNINGSLGQSIKGIRPIHRMKQLSLPTRLIEVCKKPNSTTTLQMVFDGGWAISMRLHSADSKVKTTGLKWDVQLIGMPTGLYEQERPWQDWAAGDGSVNYQGFGLSNNNR